MTIEPSRRLPVSFIAAALSGVKAVNDLLKADADDEGSQVYGLETKVEGITADEPNDCDHVYVAQNNHVDCMYCGEELR